MIEGEKNYLWAIFNFIHRFSLCGTGMIKCNWNDFERLIESNCFFFFFVCDKMSSF